MVYCSECGARNDEDASFCSRCGAALRSEMVSVRPLRHRVRAGGWPWRLLIGLVIVLWGLTELLGIGINLFALVAVIIGVLITVGALGRAASQ